MSARDLWKAPTVVPTLAYVDVPRAVAWLVDAFGLRERAGARLAWPGGCMTWLEVGDGLIHLETSEGSASASLKVYVADVDAHFAHAKAAGATITSEPEDGFWGGRIYRAVDLEAQRWEFSQRGRDLAVEHWRLPPGLTRR